MDSRDKLIIDLADSLKAFKSVPTELEVISASPVGLDRLVVNPKDPDDIDIIFNIKGDTVRGAMIVTPTESTAILRDKIRQIKEFVSNKQYILPFIGGRFFGEGDRNIAMMEGVNLFDLAGNVYLNTPRLHYEKVVTKNPYAAKPTLKELFSPVSSRLVRVLLTSPDKKWYVSELAKEADVSIALAYRFIEKLREDKLVERYPDKQIAVTSPGEILDRWVRAKKSYRSYTQQRFGFYSYKKDIPSIFEAITNVNNDQYMKYALSFSTGAYLVAPFITTINKVQMYINNSVDIDTWKRILDLTPIDRGANVEIYMPYDKGVFYGVQQVTLGQGSGTIDVVSNVQLYLDIINDPARGEEQATHLREVKLHF
jgi:hypothetical protein